MIIATLINANYIATATTPYLSRRRKRYDVAMICVIIIGGYTN